MALFTLTICFVLAMYTTESHPATQQKNLNLTAIDEETLVNALVKALGRYKKVKMQSTITIEKRERPNPPVLSPIPPNLPSFPTPSPDETSNGSSGIFGAPNPSLFPPIAPNFPLFPTPPPNDTSTDSDEIWERGKDGNLYLATPKSTKQIPTTESTSPDTTTTRENTDAGARSLNFLPPLYPTFPPTKRPGRGGTRGRGGGRGRDRGRPPTSPPSGGRVPDRPTTTSIIKDKGVCSTQILEEYTRVTGMLYDDPAIKVTLFQEIYPRNVTCRFDYPSTNYKNPCVIKGYPLGAWIRVSYAQFRARKWKRCLSGGFGYWMCWDHIVVPGCCVMAKEYDRR